MTGAAMRLDYTPAVMLMVHGMGLKGEFLMDQMDRLRVLEACVLEIEGERQERESGTK